MCCIFKGVATSVFNLKKILTLDLSSYERKTLQLKYTPTV
jgi:hypothetical protein